MAARPQDYVPLGGRMTTNTVEGFHGLALMYRDKRTDLGHTHYVCKTNMAVCHKVRYCNTTKKYLIYTYTYIVYMIVESWSNLEAAVLGKHGG